MFKILIQEIIHALDFVTQELKRAYEETYELSDLSKEFANKVQEIREKNKRDFIKAAKVFERNKGLFTLEFPTSFQIEQRAKKDWEEALAKGDLDELYNIKERNKNEYN